MKALILAALIAAAGAPDRADAPLTPERAKAIAEAAADAQRAGVLVARPFNAAVPGEGERSITAWYLRGKPVRLTWPRGDAAAELLVDEHGRVATLDGAVDLAAGMREGLQALVDRAAQAEVPSAPEPKEPGLRAELLALAVDDQAARQSPEPAAWAAADRFNTLRLGEIVARYGWPGNALVGADGAHAAWLLLQHAPAVVQRADLPLLRAAVARGDADPTDLAYLEDRVAMGKGLPQVYGTQFMLDPETDVYELHPVADPQGLDARRRSLGLPPMAEYTALINKGRVPKPLTVKQPAFRAELLRLAAIGTTRAAIDAKRQIRRHGWPTRSSVGMRAVNEVVGLAVKARLDLAFMRAFAKAQAQAFDRGETDGGTYAYLVDALRKREGLKQLYGTDFVWADGHWSASPIHEPMGLEARRARLKMMPFAQWEPLMRDMPPPPGKE